MLKWSVQLMHICSQGPLRPFWSQLCLIRLALSLLVTTSRKTFTSKGTKLKAGHKYFDSQGFSTERRTPSLEIFYFIKKNLHICLYMYDVNAIHDNLSTSKLITYAGFFRSENNFAIWGKILISYLIFLFVCFFFPVFLRQCQRK